MNLHNLNFRHVEPPSEFACCCLLLVLCFCASVLPWLTFAASCLLCREFFPTTALYYHGDLSWHTRRHLRRTRFARPRLPLSSAFCRAIRPKSFFLLLLALFRQYLRPRPAWSSISASSRHGEPNRTRLAVLPAAPPYTATTAGLGHRTTPPGEPAASHGWQAC